MMHLVPSMKPQPGHAERRLCSRQVSRLSRGGCAEGLRDGRGGSVVEAMEGDAIAEGCLVRIDAGGRGTAVIFPGDVIPIGYRIGVVFDEVFPGVDLPVFRNTIPAADPDAVRMDVEDGAGELEPVGAFGVDGRGAFNGAPGIRGDKFFIAGVGFSGFFFSGFSLRGLVAGHVEAFVLKVAGLNGAGEKKCQHQVFHNRRKNLQVGQSLSMGWGQTVDCDFMATFICDPELEPEVCDLNALQRLALAVQLEEWARQVRDSALPRPLSLEGDPQRN